MSGPIEHVVFFNPANRGDLHVSRELVRYSIERLRAERGVKKFSYCHRNPPEILRDIDGLEHMPPAALIGVDQSKDVFQYLDGGATLALNTWYAKSPAWGDGNGFGCTINTLIELFRLHLFRHFDLLIEEPVERFIPRIDFSRFHVHNTIANRMHFDGYRKRVLFCNGPALSGQSGVDDATMAALLRCLAVEFRDVRFIATGEINGVAPQANIIESRAVIGTPSWGNCDLNETAALGVQCDLVIGRCSGPQSFCYNTDVLFDAAKTLICFCDDERTAKWVYMSDAVKAKVIWTPRRDFKVLHDLIAAEIAP